jgi:hypothetical protein
MVKKKLFLNVVGDNIIFIFTREEMCLLSS